VEPTLQTAILTTYSQIMFAIILNVINITKYILLSDSKFKTRINTFQTSGKITTQLILKAILQN
jgi:hypothetical protein